MNRYVFYLLFGLIFSIAPVQVIAADPDNVLIRGWTLKLVAGQNPIWVTEGQQSFLHTDLIFTGGKGATVDYELLNAPPGMSVTRNGTVRWAPPVGSRGTNYSFSLRATTRSSRLNLDAGINLQMFVAPSDLINAEINVAKNELKIVDPSSNLNDIRFRFLTDSIQDLEFRKIEQRYITPIDPTITRLTDVFYTTHKRDGEMEIFVPISLLSDSKSPFLLVQYYRVSDQRGSAWYPSRPARRQTIIDGVEYAVIESRGLGNERFLGLYPLK